jgi:hypothetical protein
MLQETVGLPLNQMSDTQRELAKTLLEEWIDRIDLSFGGVVQAGQAFHQFTITFSSSKFCMSFI